MDWFLRKSKCMCAGGQQLSHTREALGVAFCPAYNTLIVPQDAGVTAQAAKLWSTRTEALGITRPAATLLSSRTLNP